MNTLSRTKLAVLISSFCFASTLSTNNAQADYFDIQQYQILAPLKERTAAMLTQLDNRQVIYQVNNKQMTTLTIKKTNDAGRACFHDLRQAKNPRYRPPIGEQIFQIDYDQQQVIRYPSVGDSMNDCRLSLADSIKETTHLPLAKFKQQAGLFACAATGCTQNDLNYFEVEDFDDQLEWIYRTVTFYFDQNTKILMQKSQGLGTHPKIQRNNLSQELFFTYPTQAHNTIAYHGIWQQTQYQSKQQAQQQPQQQSWCLLIQEQQVYRLEKEPEQACSNNPEDYLQTANVADQYPDMWWLNANNTPANLAQLNMMVRWPDRKQAQYTTWEYLPAGQTWDQGILYRYRQHVLPQTDGSDQVQTHTISQFVKVAGA